MSATIINADGTLTLGDARLALSDITALYFVDDDTVAFVTLTLAVKGFEMAPIIDAKFNKRDEPTELYAFDSYVLSPR